MVDPVGVAAGIIGMVDSAIQLAKRLERGKATTISEKTMGSQDELPIPEPKELYDSKTEFEDWDYCGNHKGLLFWEPSKGIKPVITEGQEPLRLYPEDEWGFWMVGTDKEHVQPTVVTFSEQTRHELARELLKSTITVGGSGKPVGTLALNSRPAFQVSRRQLYGVPDEIEEGTATRVAVLSLREDHWKIITIGGFVKSTNSYGEETLGLTVASPFADFRKLDEIPDDEIRPRASKLTATSDSSRQIVNTGPVRDLAFQRGEPIGYVDRSPEWNKSQGWTLVHLDFMATQPKQSHIRAPDGELYVTTEFVAGAFFEEDMPAGDVWIVTAKGVIIVEGLKRARSSDIVNAWQVRVKPGTLEPEDAGSWVIAPTRPTEQPDTGSRSGTETTKPFPCTCTFLGMVSKIKHGYAYLLPASVFEPAGLTLQIDSSSSRSSVEPSSDLPFLDRLRSGPRTYGPYLEHIPQETIWEIPIKNGLKAWALEGPAAKEWKNIEPKIEDIIRQTPAKSKSDVIPSIAVCGFMVGRDRNHAAPTVAITCDSKAYISQLERVMRKIGVLHGTKFTVMNLDKTIEPLTSSGTSTWSSVFRPRPIPAILTSAIKFTSVLRARALQDEERGEPLVREERRMQKKEVDPERRGRPERPRRVIERGKNRSERMQTQTAREFSDDEISDLYAFEQTPPERMSLEHPEPRMQQKETGPERGSPLKHTVPIQTPLDNLRLQRRQSF